MFPVQLDLVPVFFKLKWLSTSKSTLCLILILLGITSPTEGDVGEDAALSFEDPWTCNLSRNETFSWASLSCVKCQWKYQHHPDYCQCPGKTVLGKSSSGLGCSRCPENTMVWDKHCIPCGKSNPYSLTLERCQPCPQGHIEVAYHSNGELKDELECIRCTSGFHPNPFKTLCIPCHPSFPQTLTLTSSTGANTSSTSSGSVSGGNGGSCSCPELTHSEHDQICFSNSEKSDPTMANFDEGKASYKIEYEGFKSDSPLFREKLLAAFYLCKGKQNQSACQMLANMCTLNLHSYSEEWNSCRLYRTALPGPVSHPPAYMPKIYYSDVEAPSVLMRSTTIPHTHNTDYSSPTSHVNITLAKFSFEGEFEGLFGIEDIIPCREPKAALQASGRFGTNFKLSCGVNVQDVWREFGAKGKMGFLDPYVSYENLAGGAKTRQLYAVPIKIQNFKRSGVKINIMEDKYQWQLVRRFFLIDGIGSVDEKDKDGSKPKVVRYLKDLHVRVQLQNSHEAGKIYIPLITLTYADMTQDAFNRNELLEFTYTVDYFMDMSRSIEDIKISIGVLSALAVLWSAIQAWGWNRRNGQLEIDLTTISNLLITCCGNLADVFFIVCFCTGLFWFTFFKKQVAVHVFLPDRFQERLVRDLMISAFALKIVAILELIRKQSTVDIFFVDWERPKVRNSVQHPIISQHGQKHNESSKPDLSEKVLKSEETVSIWRTYFIANEWNEIQTTRKIHIAAQLVATLFFLEVVGMKFWGLHWPLGDLSPDEHLASSVPYSTSARFVVASLVFGLLGIIQWIFRVGFYERYVENEIQDFVDLCTMANISVFILSAKQHGYYIHGRSVHGFADTDMQTMIEQLNREEEDLCGRRGLLPQTDQQTFLISVPGAFRSVYNQVLQPLYASSASTSALFSLSRGRLASTSHNKGGGVAAKPSQNMLNLSVHAYHSMNRFLAAFLEHALSDLDYDIVNKTFFESTFDMEFNEVGNDRAVFYTDTGHSFDSVLFYGHERTLFLFNLYAFVFLDLLSHNYILAGVFVFILDLVLKAMRNFLGKRNLARKTLIDGRFLI